MYNMRKKYEKQYKYKKKKVIRMGDFLALKINYNFDIQFGQVRIHQTP